MTARDGLRIETGEPRDTMILVHDDVAAAQLRERAEASSTTRSSGLPTRPLGPAAAEQPMLGDHGELKARGHETLAQRGMGEPQRTLARELRRATGIVLEPRSPQPSEVVGGALALAAPRVGNNGPICRAHVLLEGGLGLLHRSRADVGGLRAEFQRLAGRQRRQADPRTSLQRGLDRRRLHVEVVGVVVVEGGADVLPLIGERGRYLLLGREDDLRLRGHEVEQGTEAVDRQQLGDVRAFVRAGDRSDLGELAMFGPTARRPARSRPRRGRPASAA